MEEEPGVRVCSWHLQKKKKPCFFPLNYRWSKKEHLKYFQEETVNRRRPAGCSNFCTIWPLLLRRTLQGRVDAST